MKKMVKYILVDDGSAICATSPLDLVEKMRDSSRFANGESVGEFMVGFSKRYKEQTGRHIIDNDVSWFVSDLKAYGFLRVEDLF